MVWPRRKIQLVASFTAPGIGGVRAVLEGIKLEFSEVELTKDLRQDFKEQWLEKPFEAALRSESERFGPVTEVVYWPERQKDDVWKEEALAQGIKQQPIQSFIHNILEDQLIIWVKEPTVFINKCPLVGHILKVAGFEPTILWPTEEGNWQCERRQGLHWLIPQSWLEGLMETDSLGRGTPWAEEGVKTSWVVRETQIDFYRSNKGQNYVGYLPRWPRSFEEQEAAQCIARCIDLGVSWLDIKLALSSVLENISMSNNLRWNIDDFGRNAGARGEELSAVSFEHMEDWRSG